MKKILVIAECDQNQNTLKKSTLATLKAAQMLGGETTLLLAGSKAHTLSKEAAQCEGVHEIIVNPNTCYDHGIAENISQLVTSLAKNYAYILAPATTFGKDFLPRVAAQLEVSQLSDVCAILSEDTFQRFIYAGSALATVKTNAPVKLLTIRPSAFDSVKIAAKAPAAIIENNECFDDERVKFAGEKISHSIRPALSNALVIVSGGRALQSTEQFHELLEPLANKLNAAIGASRAAVDAGYAPNDYQVGQTGQIVAPELYIAIGISGAIQHVAGMKDSKIIVAINKDGDAPIMQIADYSLVGDLFTIVPELTSKLSVKSENSL